MRRLASAALVAMLAGCGGPSQPGRTGVALVDACLHWTACITPPASLPPSAYRDSLETCIMGSGPPGQPARLSWASGGIAVTPAQLDCVAAAGLDCERALDCVSSAAPTDCASPTWTCDGDTLTRCDEFRGARVVTEDCAAEGLHCVAVGNEARCGLAACDPKTFAAECVDNRVAFCQPAYGADGAMIGGVVVPEDDCGAHDATCIVGSNGAACVGNGAACTFVPQGDLACDGDVLVTCDESGHQERTDCAAMGLHCVTLSPNPAGFTLACASHPGLVTCTEGPTFGACDGTRIQYCDDNGNEELDCKSLGYSDCTDGHCVP